MPKATKLHSKGKPTTIQKECKSDNESEGTNPEEAVRQFQLELCWCIQQLERNLSDKKSSEKQVQEAWKVLTVLKNNNQPVIRKRQLMRNHFGNYRAKMAAEEKKLSKMTSKMKISEKLLEPPKATFLRKSVFQSTGDESFRFNFSLAPEQVELVAPEESNTTITDNNITKDSNLPVSSDGNTSSVPVIPNSNFKFKFSESAFKFNFPIEPS